ncbi:hypothetical protein OAG99_01775 [Akkermansiaceae bacterium]|nr:hypothetical protein [Akkermansiaceae bacterium]
MSAKDNPVELPRKLLLSHKKSPAEDGEVYLLEHTDGTTESAWNLIAADAGHQDINGCNLDIQGAQELPDYEQDCPSGI